jgi:tetratricopeptide (TPR) repeat protein
VDKGPAPFRLVLAFGLVAATTAACSQEEQTNDQHLSRANDYFLAEQYQKAEAGYREVFRGTRLDQAYPIAIGRLGVFYFEAGQIQKAFPLLKKAAEVQPKLGLAHLSDQAFKKARETALYILEKQLGHQDALLLLAGAAVVVC